MHDTEDKQWWCLTGAKHEPRFCYLLQTHYGKNAYINPRKKQDIYAPDLLIEGYLADLKTQNTPFFSAKHYGLDPQFTVTFNRKDYARYSEFYPFVHIYFWLDWQTLQLNSTKVLPMIAIFATTFQCLVPILLAAPEHFYKRRTNDTTNAKSSFLLDIRQFKKILLLLGNAIQLPLA